LDSILQFNLRLQKKKDLTTIGAPCGWCVSIGTPCSLHGVWILATIVDARTPAQLQKNALQIVPLQTSALQRFWCSVCFAKEKMLCRVVYTCILFQWTTKKISTSTWRNL